MNTRWAQHVPSHAGFLTVSIGAYPRKFVLRSPERVLVGESPTRTPPAPPGFEVVVETTPPGQSDTKVFTLAHYPSEDHRIQVLCLHSAL